MDKDVEDVLRLLKHKDEVLSFRLNKVDNWQNAHDEREAERKAKLEDLAGPSYANAAKSVDHFCPTADSEVAAEKPIIEWGIQSLCLKCQNHCKVHLPQAMEPVCSYFAPTIEQKLGVGLEEVLAEATIQPLCQKCNHSCKVWGEGATMTECGHYDDGTRDNSSQVTRRGLIGENLTSIEQKLEAGLARFRNGAKVTRIYLPVAKWREAKQLTPVETHMVNQRGFTYKHGRIHFNDIPVFNHNDTDIHYCTD